MKLMSILFFAGGAIFLVMAFSLAVTRGVFGALDLSVFDFYFVVRPLYLLLIAAALFATGWLTFAHPLP